MLTAINGYYNGSYIVTEGNIALKKGQKVIITLDIPDEKTVTKVDLSRFMGKGEKMLTTDATEYVRGLRENDRL